MTLSYGTKCSVLLPLQRSRAEKSLPQELPIDGIRQLSELLKSDGDLGLEFHLHAFEGVGRVRLPLEPLDAGVGAVRRESARGRRVVQAVVHPVQRAVTAGVEPPAGLVLLAAVGPPHVVVPVRGREAHALVIAQTVPGCAVVAPQLQSVVVLLTRHPHLQHTADTHVGQQARLGNLSNKVIPVTVTGLRDQYHLEVHVSVGAELSLTKIQIIILDTHSSSVLNLGLVSLSVTYQTQTEKRRTPPFTL